VFAFGNESKLMTITGRSDSSTNPCPCFLRVSSRWQISTGLSRLSFRNRITVWMSVTARRSSGSV
jgi:hypothetical protein